MNRSQFPQYVKVLEYYLKDDNRNFDKFRKHPSLDRMQMTLMEARALFNKQSWAVALKILTALDTKQNAFFTGEKFFLQATAHFFSGRIEDAAFFNAQAWHYYSVAKDQRGEFLSLYNLSVDYGRLGINQLSELYLKAAEARAESVSEKLLILRAWACHYSKHEKFPEAVRCLDLAYLQYEGMSLSDKRALDAVAIDIYVRAGELQKALRSIEMGKANKIYPERARIDFEEAVLHALSGSSALPSKIPLSCLKAPEYKNRWLLLVALQSGDLSAATVHWGQLIKIAPQIYDKDFRPYSAGDSRNSFFRYLSLLRKSSPDLTVAEDAQKNKLGLLLRVLSASEFPLRKEELIEKVWAAKYDPAMDSRFYKLIERFKKQYPNRVVYKNRAYSLVS